MRAVPALLVAVLIAGCGGASLPEPENPAPANSEVATQLVVEQFLRAVNSNDLDTMARLFGTVDGSILKWEARSEVDQRMFALASILRHDSFTIRRFEIVPGRRDEARRAIVNMKIGEREIDVPYTLVWSNDRSWRIENIGIQNITNRS
jgi:hypothetical protein